MRRLPSLLLPLALGACGLMPATQQQSFTVSGADPTPVATAQPFQNTDPKIDTVLAKQVCVDDFQKQDQKTLPADSTHFEQWQVQCKPYHPTLLAWVPLPPLW